MKQLLTVSLVLLGIFPAWCQATLEVGGEQIAGTSLGNGRWQFTVGGESFILIQEQTLSSLSQQVEEGQADVERLQKIVEAKDELLTAFESFEDTAKAFIDIQQRTLATADSLYRGYEDLYQDSKKLWDTSGFSIIPGVGLVSPESGNQFVGSLGIEYEGFQGSIQIGRNYEGVLFGYRFKPFR